MDQRSFRDCILFVPALALVDSSFAGGAEGYFKEHAVLTASTNRSKLDGLVM